MSPHRVYLLVSMDVKIITLEMSTRAYMYPIAAAGHPGYHWMRSHSEYQHIDNPNGHFRFEDTPEPRPHFSCYHGLIDVH